MHQKEMHATRLQCQDSVGGQLAYPSKKVPIRARTLDGMDDGTHHKPSGEHTALHLYEVPHEPA
eukprot:5665120-Amphidinium_carterae.2